MTALARVNTRQMRRVALSSWLGSVFEFYDFLLYATAAALVFAPVFFAGLDPAVGTIASLATLAAGYITRPLGAVVFGHFGDRLGRKRMLITTMSVMGVSSTLIGLLPTSSQIGVAAPVLLVLLRVVQGFALGGEWGGAVLMSAEHAAGRRGLWASITTAGGPSGALLSAVTLAVLSATTTDQQFLTWGWRVPFLLSAVLLVIGLFVRARVEESPVFLEAADRDAPTDRVPPVLDILRNRPSRLFLSIGVGLSGFVMQAITTTFVLSYAVDHGQPRSLLLNVLSMSAVVGIVGLLGWSALSDRVGRKPVVLAGTIAAGVWGFALFPMIDSAVPALLVLGIAVATVAQAAISGPSSALFTEMFRTRSRYTGASLCYQVASTVAGFVPVAYASLYVATGSSVLLAAVTAAVCVVSAACLLRLPETRDVDLAADSAGPAARL